MKKLNFGCGSEIRPKEEGWVNVDVLKGIDIDKSFNFNKFPYPFKDNTFDYVLMKGVLEHLNYVPKVMNELWRICKNNTIINIFVPYYNHPSSYNDPTHQRHLNIHAFDTIITMANQKDSTRGHFELIEVRKMTGKFKRIIPKPILKFLDRFLHSMFIEINAKIKVIKIVKKVGRGEL